MKKTLLAMFVVVGVTANAFAQQQIKPLAKCFGYQLIQHKTATNELYVLRPVDGNMINGGQDILVTHTSKPDLDVFAALIPSQFELQFVITRSFEPGANMQPRLVYKAHVEVDGHRSAARNCPSL